MFRARDRFFQKAFPLQPETRRSSIAREAQFDSGVQIAPFKGRDCKFCNIHVGKHRHALLLQFRDGRAGQPVHLEGALDPLRIVDMNARRRRRIHTSQVPGAWPPNPRSPLDASMSGPHLQVRLGQFRNSVAQGMEVQHGAAHQQRLAPAAPDILHRLQPHRA